MRKIIILITFLTLGSCYAQNGQYLGAGSAITKLLLHLNGNSNDASGNANNGTDANITYSLGNGKFGSGAGFNGISSLITINNESQFDFERTNSFTIGVWIKLNEISNKCILNKINVLGNYEGFQIYTTSQNKINVGLISNGYTSNQIDVTSIDTVLIDKWHNIIVTYNGSSLASGISIYLNGSKLSTTSLATTLTGSILNNIKIGIGRRWTTEPYLNGYLDEIIIENRAWTASEVKKYFSYTKAIFGID